MATLRRMRRKPLLRIGVETAEVFGALAARLAKSGRGYGYRVQDVWLAAQAIARKFTLLTANARDFRDVPGLQFLAVEGVSPASVAFGFGIAGAWRLAKGVTVSILVHESLEYGARQSS